MQIVIDIDDEVYNFIKNKGHIPYGINIANEIANGTVLPKGHGDLIYRDEAFDVLDNANLSLNLSGLLRYVSTVIPADK